MITRKARAGIKRKGDAIKGKPTDRQTGRRTDGQTDKLTLLRNMLIADMLG